MNAKMNTRRAKLKAAKKAAKEAKKKGSSDFKVPSSDPSGHDQKAGSSSSEPPLKKLKPEDVSAFKNQQKLSGGSVPATAANKKSSKSSVQDDPSKSEVYKRLFSSHKSAQNLPKGNWVTFDPRYN